MRPTLRAYGVVVRWPGRALPWLIAGRLLFAPFPPRNGGPTTDEADAIQAMGGRLDRDRRAGLLPDSVAYWFCPIDGGPRR